MSESPVPSPPGRLASLDAYRGFVMLAMASAGLGLPSVANHFPDSQVWSVIHDQLEHVRWRGCGFWDLIQPSFMFIVGVAMPFSYANRRARGQGRARLFAHALGRSLVLIALGVFLSSAWSPRTNFVFVNVLAQIGLGYPLVFLLLDRPPKVQLAAALAILVGYWLWFAASPVPGPERPFRERGISADWRPMQGFAAHWEKNANPVAAFDRWFLNLFPQPTGEPFRFNKEGYATLNFIPSIATMLFGVLAGELLQGRRSGRSKVQALVIAGAGCLVLGMVLDGPVCPIVKKIWTPSWTIYSTGWACLLLAVFYGVIDVAGYRRWAFPLVVVGLNSIAMYVMAQLLKPFVAGSLKIHLGPLWSAVATSPAVDGWVYRHSGAHLAPQMFGGLYGPVVQASAVLLVLWLICFWMYRQRIFLRI